MEGQNIGNRDLEDMVSTEVLNGKGGERVGDREDRKMGKERRGGVSGGEGKG